MTEVAVRDLAMMVLTAAIEATCPSLMECVRGELSIEAAFKYGTQRELEAIVQCLENKTGSANDRMERDAHAMAADYVWKRFYPRIGFAANDG